MLYVEVKNNIVVAGPFEADSLPVVDPSLDILFVDITGTAIEFVDTVVTYDGTSFSVTPIEEEDVDYTYHRAAEYPSLEEQADMAYWDRQNGTTVLDDAITAVKVKYPKGDL